MAICMYHVLFAVLWINARGHELTCSQSYVSSMDHHGVIQSYNYPFHYRDSLTCSYHIYIDNTEVDQHIKSAYSKGAMSQIDGVADIDPLAVVQAQVCLRFHRFTTENRDTLTIEANISSYMYHNNGVGVENYSDKENVWLDPFCFYPRNGVLTLKFRSDTSIVKPGFYATFWTVLESTIINDNENHMITTWGNEDVYPNTSAPCFDDNLSWTCFNRGCISTHQLCDGVNSCGDMSDEMYTHAGCTTGAYGPSLYGCAFSDGNGCGLVGIATPGWSMETYSDGLNLDNDRMPNGDHTVGNVYGSAYIKTIFGTPLSDIHNLGLLDPDLELGTNSSYCLSFWYHMVGPRVGRLRVSFYDNPQHPVWSRTSNYSARWLHGQFFIDHMEGKVIFEGQRSNDYDTTFALDDLSLTEDTSCDNDDISCNFEYNFCGWRYAEGSFMRAYGRLLPHGPDHDPVSAQKVEHYIVMTSDSQLSGNLTSPTWGNPVTTDHGMARYGGCLVMWIYSSNEHGEINIQTLDMMGKRNLVTSMTPGISDGDWKDGFWKQIKVDVTAEYPFNVEIEALKSQSAHLALDDVEIIPGSCNLIDLQSCALDEFMCSSDHMCIQSFRMCDGYHDCADSSDETTQACCYVGGCSQGDFCCSNTICISEHSICDGYNGCGDWSDEEHCNSVCGPDMFTCEENNMCISTTYQCDGHSDCSDLTESSDEKNCGSSLPPAAIISIAVVFAILAIILAVRLAICIRQRGCQCNRCCSACTDAEVDDDGGDTEIEQGLDSLYQQPPEYQECINNPVYRKPKHMSDAPEGSPAPPSYDRVEKGEYQVSDVTNRAALARLRHNIMAKSREAFDISNDSISTIIALEVSVQAEIEDIEDQMRQQGQHGVINESFYSSIEEMTNVGTERVHNREDDDQAQQVQLRRQFERVAVVQRESSNASGVSVPRYSDLIHPPGYDNLSFCGDEISVISEICSLPSENNQANSPNSPTNGIPHIPKNLRPKTGPKTARKPTAEQVANVLVSARGSVICENPSGPERTHSTHRITQLYRTESDRLKTKIRKKERRSKKNSNTLDEAGPVVVQAPSSTVTDRGQHNGHYAKSQHVMRKRHQGMNESTILSRSHSDGHLSCEDHVRQDAIMRQEDSIVSRSRSHNDMTMGVHNEFHSSTSRRHSNSPRDVCDDGVSGVKLAQFSTLARSMPCLAHTATTSQRVSRIPSDQNEMARSKSTPFALDNQELSMNDCRYSRLCASQGQLRLGSMSDSYV